MALTKSEVKNQCMNALLQTGASKDTCEFFADAVQYEHDVSLAVCRLRKELNDAEEHQTDASILSSILQSMSKTFLSWRKTFDSLLTRQNQIPAIQVDAKKFNQESELRALCFLQTQQIKLSEGDAVKIVDSSQPNKFKVRTMTGDEGYVPITSCILPAPDITPRAVIDRLQIYMLMCWYDLDNRAKTTLIRCVFATTADMWTNWRSQKSKRTKFDERIGRRLKRLMGATSFCEGTLDCNRLHQILSSLENELTSKNSNNEFTKMIGALEELDKAVLYYEAFRRHWRLFRQDIKDSATGMQPMRLIFNWDPSIFTDPKKTYKYYEVKLTTEERTVREETVLQSAAPVTVSEEAIETQSALQSATSPAMKGKDLDYGDGNSQSRMSTETTTTTVETTIESSTERGRRRIGSRESAERWTHDYGEETLTIGTIEEMSRRAEGVSTAATEYRTSYSGGSTRQLADAEQVVMASHEETSKFVVTAVIDPSDGKHLTMHQAVAAGVIDQPKGLYINPKTGESISIASAMSDGRIVIEQVRTTRTPEITKSVGLVTIRTETDTREYTISAAIDTATGEKVDINEANRREIIDEISGSYFNKATGHHITLDDAIEAGLVIVEFEDGSLPPSCETKTYAVSAIVDQLRRRAVPFPEAVENGLIDRDTGCYVNNVTGERVFAGEAVRRGFFKCQLVDDPNSLIGIDSNNKVVVDRIDRVRKNVLRGVQVMSAFKQSTKNR